MHDAALRLTLSSYHCFFLRIIPQSGLFFYTFSFNSGSMGFFFEKGVKVKMECWIKGCGSRGGSKKKEQSSVISLEPQSTQTNDAGSSFPLLCSSSAISSALSPPPVRLRFSQFICLSAGKTTRSVVNKC